MSAEGPTVIEELDAAAATTLVGMPNPRGYWPRCRHGRHMKRQIGAHGFSGANRWLSNC
jgi:hypothetical protein